MYLSRLLLAIWFFGLTGTAAELLLLGHFEGWKQVVPLALFGLGLVVGGWYAARPSQASLTAFRLGLGALLAGGPLGIWFHYRGNVEFEIEMYPGLAGWQLFKQVMTGATPALAPGTMVLLALIGFAATVARSRQAAS